MPHAAKETTKKATKKTTAKKAAAKKQAAKKPVAKKTVAKAKTVKKAAPSQKGGGAKLRVKQVRSEIGHAGTYRRTLLALGLRHYQYEVTVADNASMRGMLHKVRHLVRVTPEEA